MKEFDFGPKGKLPKNYGLTGRDGPPGSEMMIRGVPAFLCQNDTLIRQARRTPLDKERFWFKVHYIRKELKYLGLNLSALITSGRDMLFQNPEFVSGRTRGEKVFDNPFYNNQSKRTKLFVMGAFCKKNRMERVNAYMSISRMLR